MELVTSVKYVVHFGKRNVINKVNDIIFASHLINSSRLNILNHLEENELLKFYVKLMPVTKE